MRLIRTSILHEIYLEDYESKLCATASGKNLEEEEGINRNLVKHLR